MSESNRVQVRYSEESTFDTAPTGAYEEFAYTSESIQSNTDSTTSAIVRDDAQVADVIRTSVNVSGDLNTELIYGNMDDLIEGFMRSTWAADLGITSTLSADGATNEFTSPAVNNDFTNVVVGQWILTAGFSTNPANNGYFKVVEKDETGDPHTIKVIGGTLVTETGDGDETITGSVIQNGTTDKSFTIEKEYKDLTDIFDHFTGCRVGTFNTSISTESVITATLGIQGATPALTQTSAKAGSVNAYPNNNVMNSIDHIAMIMVDQSATVLDTTEISLSGTNNVRNNPKLGKLGPAAVKHGTFGFEGSFVAYFEDRSILDKYRAWGDLELAWKLEDDAGNAYIFDLENVKITNSAPVSEGLNNDVMANADFTAYVGGTSGKMFTLTRFAAP